MSFGGSTILLAWLVNTPQLVLSLCYLGLNNICTSLASADEWNKFAYTRKSLRVSQPIAQQRSTYFLQLPYRWAVPLMITSSTLHWLLSQSFFLVRVDSFERNSDVPNDNSKSACGYSSLSLQIFLLVCLLLMCTITYLTSRRMQQRMPLAASCSLVISAACHPAKDEVDIHLRRIRWGVTQQPGSEGVGHCSFSAGPVKKPEAERVYR
jgi:hypothetical protein